MSLPAPASRSDRVLAAHAKCLAVAAGLALVAFASSARAQNVADLEASVTLSADAAVGEPLLYTVVVLNHGPNAAHGAAAHITVPTGLTFLSSDPGGAFDSSTSVLTVSIGDIGARFDTGYRFQLRRDVPGTLTVSAFVDATTTDPNTDDNHAYLAAAGVAPATGASGAYHFYQVATTALAKPDRPTEKFTFPTAGDVQPALDGDRVVFLASDDDKRPELWSASLDGTGLTRLADSATPIPAQAGGLLTGIASPRLRNGLAVFYAQDVDAGDASTVRGAGIYGVSVAGGGVATVIDAKTPLPGGAAGQTVGLTPYTVGALSEGRIAVAFPNGNGAAAFALAGSTVALQIARPGANPVTTPGFTPNGSETIGAPSLSGNQAVFLLSVTGGASAVTSLFGEDQRYTTVAGEAGDGFYPVGAFEAPQVEAGVTVFGARTGAAGEVRGIFSRTGSAAAVRLVDTSTAAPGGVGNFQAFGVTGSGDLLALNAGEVVFVGVDATGATGLYSVAGAGGAITRVVAVGDSLGGGLVLSGFSGAPIQANSLGNHQVVFRATFTNTTRDGTDGEGIFVATTDPRAALSTVELTTDVPAVTGDGNASGEFTVTRRGGDVSQPLKVKLTIGGSAVAGDDYNAILPTVKFKPGKLSKHVFITPIDRGQAGGTVKVKVTLKPKDTYIVGTSAKAKIKIAQ